MTTRSYKAKEIVFSGRSRDHMSRTALGAPENPGYPRDDIPVGFWSCEMIAATTGAGQYTWVGLGVHWRRRQISLIPGRGVAW
jgi:hypothetical protein